MDTNFDITAINFDENGLVPAIVQEITSGKVLMLAYMNVESIQKTLETGTTWFYSRSRRSLWNKGETSGNTQSIKRIRYDCDGDSLLVEVEQKGVACHTGEYSCFHRPVFVSDNVFNPSIVSELYQFILKRRESPEEGSYTNYLFSNGIDKILKKIGEEASEVIIGAKNPDKEELVYELSDLVYHSIVLMVEKGVTLEDLNRELTKRMLEKRLATLKEGRQ